MSPRCGLVISADSKTFCLTWHRTYRSCLVGANNSGKTSTAHALQLFVNPKEAFSIHDFNSECWGEIDAFGEQAEGVRLPKIAIDLWFHVEAVDLYRVIDLLPKLTWQGSEVGLRIEFAASDEAGLLNRFREAKTKAEANVRPAIEGARGYHPPPRTMTEYLTDSLNDEFSFHYYVLDRARFDTSFTESPEVVSRIFRTFSE